MTALLQSRAAQIPPSRSFTWARIAALLVTIVLLTGLTYLRVSSSPETVSVSQGAHACQLTMHPCTYPTVHPHFLFNALTTIGHLIHVAPTRAVAVLLRLTDVLRSVLRRSSDDSSTLGEEIDFVASYLEIERARYEERLNVQIDVPSDLRGVTVPSLVLQPLVENAIKHGIAPTRAGGVVRIRAFGTPGRLHLEVGDTGVGFEPGGEVRHGVGLTNVRRRLVLRYGETADLEILSAPGSGTTVLIELPMSSTAESSGHGRLAGRSAGR